MIRRLSMTLALLLVSSLGLSHWFSIQVLDEAPTEQLVTNYRCLDSGGITVSTQSTQAALISDCTRIATERGGEFTAATYDSINRVTRTHAIRGSTSLQVTSADANMIMVGGGGSPTVAPPSSGYTLASIGVVPFAYSEPIPPTITSEATVTPATFAANNVAGRRIILTAGDYGNIALGTDQELVTTTGVIINTLNLENAHRVIVRASPVRTGTINTFGSGVFNIANDILIDGIFTDSTALTDERNIISGSRIAVINSRIKTKDFTIATFPANANGPNDVIVANNDLHAFGGMEAGNRLQNAQRVVMVDNRVRLTGSERHNLRFHAPTGGQDADNLYVAGNQFEGPVWMIRPIPGGIGTGDPHVRMINVWVVDNTMYHATPLWNIQTGTTADGDYPEVITITGNQLFNDGGFFPNPAQHPWVATINNNTISAFQTPPVWNFR